MLSAIKDIYESIRPIRATDRDVNPEVTIVTGYVAIGGLPADTESSFARRTQDRYRAWMQPALSIRQNMVIFADDATADFVAGVRQHLADRTVVDRVDVDALRRSWQYRETKRIIDGGYMRGANRPNRVELRAPMYATIMFSKLQWMRAAIERDPFRTPYFLWMDAALGHGLDRRIRYRGVVNRVWPSAAKNDRLRDTILVLGTGLHLRHATPAELITGHGHLIAGGVWGGDRRKLLEFCDRFETELAWAFSQNLLDDEQSIMSLVYLKYPELFTTVDCSSRLRDRCYFMKYLDASGA